MSQARQHFARVVERHLAENHKYSPERARELCSARAGVVSFWSGSQVPMRALCAANELARLDLIDRQ